MSTTRHTFPRPVAFASLPGRPPPERDILWGRPLFKAPEIPNPRPRLEPLPFTAVRVTQPA